jgi:hypothetical protein
LGFLGLQNFAYLSGEASIAVRGDRVKVATLLGESLSPLRAQASLLHHLLATAERFDENPHDAPEAETVEHPFGTLKMRRARRHSPMKRLPKVATEMALHVLAYNLRAS